MARRLYKRPHGHSEPTVNLTPLIDVVFVILIMFIVLAPLLELEHVDLASAASASSAVSVQETSPISIHVHRDNSIVYGQQKVALNELSLKLKEAKQLYPAVRPQLFHDKSAHFGTYQSVKNVAEEAGFTEIDLILKPG